MFGPLKRCWTQDRDEYERTKRRQVDKTNFVSVYSRAHKKALTPDTIRAAFRTTGVWPFNPSVVTQDMMAPSLEISSVGHLPLPQLSPMQAVLHAVPEHQLEEAPLVQTSPARATSTVIRQFHEDQVNPASNEPRWNTLVNEALDNLASSSVAFLVSDTPITSEHQLPAFTAPSVTPIRKRTHCLRLQT